MEFRTPGQEAVYNRILPWMHELFGDALVVFEDEPLFIVNLGSAVASTRVVPWHQDEKTTLCLSTAWWENPAIAWS